MVIIALLLIIIGIANGQWALVLIGLFLPALGTAVRR